MVEYSWDDIIINPNDERLRDAIGKECYFSDYPNTFIKNINNKTEESLKLKCIKEDSLLPFINSNNSSYLCIVIKKEEPKEYVPFESEEEFIEASLEHNKNHYLFGTGIWIKCKNEFANIEPFLATVSELHNGCVCIGLYDDFISFDKLLKLCEFLDSTPCGKLKEVKNG